MTAGTFSYQELFEQYELLLDNQQKLQKSLIAFNDLHELQDLQDEQQMLIEDLKKKHKGIIRKNLEQKYLKKIEEKEHHFLKLNQNFLNTLGVKKALIQQELSDLKGAKSKLQKMKKSYVSQNVNLGKSKRFNTLH